ncbi:MAG: protein O-GlcNAcase [bacterium]|nr:protein O-GlcNAcase [bacterium]
MKIRGIEIILLFLLMLSSIGNTKSYPVKRIIISSKATVVLIPSEEQYRCIKDTIRNFTKKNRIQVTFISPESKTFEMGETIMLVGSPLNNPMLKKLLDTRLQQFDKITADGYWLYADTLNKNNIIVLGSPSIRGCNYAVQDLIQRIHKGRKYWYLEMTDRIENPSFAIRGVIEGFYGKPWSHEERLRLLEFMKHHKLNVYIYAPKWDPFHREKWRESYSSEAMCQFQELIHQGKKNGVDLGFSISPGLSIKYSAETDYQLLLKKAKAMMHLGFTYFALLLDDVPKQLNYAEDSAQYPDLASAQSALVNRLYSDLKTSYPNIKFLFCPTYYATSPAYYDDYKIAEQYWQKIGETIHPEISIFWTGYNITSPRITISDAEQMRRRLQRKLLIWDNYFANDNSIILRLVPLEGRDKNLPDSCEGIIMNPMLFAETNRIPLTTFADYAWNPSTYEPEQSYARAAAQYGGNKGKDTILKISKEFGCGHPGIRFGYGRYLIDPKKLPVSEQQKLLKRKMKRASDLIQKVKTTIDNPYLRKELIQVLTQTRAFSELNQWDWNSYGNWLNDFKREHMQRSKNK